LSLLKIPYVVDYDDAIYQRYEGHRNPLVRRLLGHKIDAIMRHASTVIVGNEYAAAHARAAGARRVEFVPTVIDLERYHPGPANDHAGFTIGWIGSSFTVKYLTLVEPAL